MCPHFVSFYYIYFLLYIFYVVSGEYSQTHFNWMDEWVSDWLTDWLNEWIRHMSCPEEAYSLVQNNH